MVPALMWFLKKMRERAKNGKLNNLTDVIIVSQKKVKIYPLKRLLMVFIS